MVEFEINEVQPELLTVISSEQAWYYKIIPKHKNQEQIQFYIDEENDRTGISEELQLLLNQDVQLSPAASSTIGKALHKFYRKSGQEGRSVSVSSNKADDFVAQLVQESKALGSSDIHIEVYDERARIRIRIDGLLVEKYKLDKNDYPALINKLKIKANLDIAEKRLPQDGRIFFASHGQKFDIRVSVLPTLHGEKIVLRLLSNDATNINIHHLGFEPVDLNNYLEGIRKPNGILLISGPTGSGKTTTLYATLKILNEEKRNILTVEDPIEYTLEGINQVQLKESIGLTFSSALKTFLRQDPDVIMLGEIRDAETAQMAIRAALTGHLVLSTIHTNSAWGTISRLLDMQVPPFLIASTLNTSVAQRLIRQLCDKCKRESTDLSSLPAGFKVPPGLNIVYEPVGCSACHYTGYKGRKAIYEVIPIDSDLITCIKNGQSDIQELLHRKGIQTLAASAASQLQTGATSIDEVYSLLMNQ